MKLEYYNCPKPEAMKPEVLPEAEFLAYVPDWDAINHTVDQYQGIKNLLIVGNGGSINSFIAIYEPLKEKATKRAYILNTVDPDYIHDLKRRLVPNDTLVIAISKSGETVTLVESLMQFVGYPMLFITDLQSPLAAIAVQLKASIIEHPPIGGRYTAFTEVALLPAALCGLDTETIFKTGREIHRAYKENNDAWQAANIMWQLEQLMYVDVYLPVYSHNLFPASNLLVQLCHESFGKDGKGQTYFAHEGPEAQHHTNQRFFGGRKNIAGWVISADQPSHPTTNHVPQELQEVTLKEHPLKVLDQIPLEQSLVYEWQGVIENAQINNIPLIHQIIASFSEDEIGRFIAFWQLYAVYSSVLRKVNPFDQPQVEASKKISFAKRLQFKGKL